jgi:hypothetical protein
LRTSYQGGHQGGGQRAAKRRIGRVEVNTYHHKRRTRDQGVRQLLLANVLVPLLGASGYLVHALVLDGATPQPIAFIWAVLVLAGVVAFNLQGILNIMADRTFEFAVTNSHVVCSVPVALHGTSFSVRLQDIEWLRVDSASEGFEYFIETSAGQRLRIPQSYGNKVSRIVEALEARGVPVERVT